MIRLYKKKVARCILLALFVLTFASTAFAATEVGASNETYQQELQDNILVELQTEQYAFSPDVPINGLFWNVGRYADKQGYWNNLGEFYDKIPNPIKEK